jgi:hypothetical protein
MLIKLQTSLMLSFSFELFIEISSPIIGPRVKVTNTLAYYDMELIATAKILIVQVPGSKPYCHWFNFSG